MHSVRINPSIVGFIIATTYPYRCLRVIVMAQAKPGWSGFRGSSPLIAIRSDPLIELLFPERKVGKRVLISVMSENHVHYPVTLGNDTG